MKHELPFPHAYWVLPGRFLAGYYPGDLDPEMAERKLRGLLQAGIRHVVNLMEEDETNWYGSLFMPYQERLAEMARERGVEITCVRLPIVDLHIPTREGMGEMLDEIDMAIR
jgi:hypothetical protein